MDGLFSLAKTLFGIDIEPADGLAPVNLKILSVAFIYRSCDILFKVV